MSKPRIVLIAWYFGVATGLLFYAPYFNQWQNNFMLASLCPVCPVCIMGVPQAGFGPLAALLNGSFFAAIVTVIFTIRALLRWVTRKFAGTQSSQKVA